MSVYLLAFPQANQPTLDNIAAGIPKVPAFQGFVYVGPGLYLVTTDTYNANDIKHLFISTPGVVVLRLQGEWSTGQGTPPQTPKFLKSAQEAF